jgi:hypothetical protein
MNVNTMTIQVRTDLGYTIIVALVIDHIVTYGLLGTLG